MSEQRLKGELAIVTGASSGIGHATAIALAKEGADVVITYLHNRAGADQTARDIEALGRKAAVYQTDQREAANVRRLFQDTMNAMGTPTILVNNAAIDPTTKEVRDMSDAEWDDAIRSNLSGPFYCCREFIRAIEGSGRHGNIINVTSVHQEAPRPGAAGYVAAKGGLGNLTATLALELAQKNINVNNLAPGMVLTPMNQKALDDPAARSRQEQAIPMKRAAEPEEIAHVAVFLASPQARYIHGATIVVDGGLLQSLGTGA